MMGNQSGGQASLCYAFNLEDHVPQDHLLRSIDRFIDLADIRRHLAPFYSSIGRSSIDPELMIRMLLVGYIMGIRSERRLCDEVHLNLAYRWFCRLDLTDPVPDHSTFSKNRHGRFCQSDLFRKLFEDVLRRTIAEGLVVGDTGYGSAEMLGWLVYEYGIKPHIPVFHCLAGKRSAAEKGQIRQTWRHFLTLRLHL